MDSMENGISLKHRIIISVGQLACILTSFLTEYVPNYHGQSPLVFFAFLTHVSNSLLCVLNLCNCFKTFRSKTNVTHFCITCSFFVLTAWIALVVPFNVSTLENPVSLVEHICPAILQASMLVAPPPPPRIIFIFCGYAYLILYLSWTLIFSLAGFTLNGNDYIYKAINWSYHPWLSLIYVSVALGMYTVVYFSVECITLMRRHTMSKKKTFDVTKGNPDGTIEV
ncbi:hypothetical protein TrLO_g9978 [Triparma laevis f. longispina]|uniref:Uncharacterized protein n=1 Tax=Triparma laevis f. longispina TaxID=1714387 RepID=A0A9W7AVW2_9STRA|nr:hypothetical protein TrLO_g9978 [Triparma laevis f. longispina]